MKGKKPIICLSFDVEEFDTPRVDHHVPIGLERQIDISRYGLVRVLDTLRGLGVRATFFITGVFAERCPALVRRIADEGHEVAAHAYKHTGFEKGDYQKVRTLLEQVTGKKVVGYRSPRMSGADDAELAAAGYLYDSSINPCWLSGKYNHAKASRTAFIQGSIVEIPASVTPWFRLPLFWLSMHVMPMWCYSFLCAWTARRDGYLNIYFHPWEFNDEIHNKELRLPFYIRRNAGEKLVTRLTRLVDFFQQRGAEFGTLGSVAKNFRDK